jgi:hypothetical protein
MAVLKADKVPLTARGQRRRENRVNSSSWEDMKVILVDEVLEARAQGKRMLVLRRAKLPKDGDDQLFDPV